MHVALHVGSHRHIAQLLHQQEEGGHHEEGGGSDVGIQTSFLAREEENGETEAGANDGKTAEKDRKGQHHFFFIRF